MFKKSEAQAKACKILNEHTHALIFGGSRSGKTTIIVRNIILRALKMGSRHLIVRLHFNAVIKSIFMDTFPKVMDMCFKDIEYKANKSLWYYTLQATNGKKSEIWFGGIDDSTQMEKILGNEYSTIYANESSEMSYDAITILRTRMAENVGLKLKFYYDLNPCGKKHWTYQEFIEGFKVGTKEKHTRDCGWCVINPYDNKENLSQEYILELENLPDRQKQRFLSGLYLSDIEGALWTDAMMSNARSKQVNGEVIKTVVAIDPAVTNNPNSDETGIVVCSLDEEMEGVVECDYSGKYNTRDWAQAAVNAYYEYEANEIVAEVNMGGDLVEDAIKIIDPTIRVVKVRAAKGKFSRAEPISTLYHEGKVAHRKQLFELETQMCEYVPHTAKESPDRLDALVWGLTHLMVRPRERSFRSAIF